jgi:hypothetical protein
MGGAGGARGVIEDAGGARGGRGGAREGCVVGAWAPRPPGVQEGLSSTPACPPPQARGRIRAAPLVRHGQRWMQAAGQPGPATRPPSPGASRHAAPLQPHGPHLLLAVAEQEDTKNTTSGARAPSTHFLAALRPRASMPRVPVRPIMHACMRPLHDASPLPPPLCFESHYMCSGPPSSLCFEKNEPPPLTAAACWPRCARRPSAAAPQGG